MASSSDKEWSNSAEEEGPESSEGCELSNEELENDQAEQQKENGQTEQEQHGTNGPRRKPKPRTPIKWPKDLIVVTDIDRGGMPREKRQRLRLRRLAGLIARQKISLVLPGFKSLDNQEKWRLFDTWVQPFLEFPAEMKPYGFRQVMKTIAKAWRNHRSKLKNQFIKKGLTPFQKHPHIEPVDWEAFVRLTESEEATKAAERFKALREQYSNEHCMGPAGYEGMEAQWEEEDSRLMALGIPNPYEVFPEGRPRNWLRARSKLEISKIEGVAHIRWKTEATKRLSEEIKEKQAYAETSSGITWIRENDVLSQCLGPEQPGRVCGVSSYNGWKYGWSQHSDMYRKRKRASSADLRAIKEELRAELQQDLQKDLVSILASQGLQIVPFSRNPSPAPGRRSSYASASEVAAGENNEEGAVNNEGEAPERSTPIRNEEDPERIELMQLDQSWSHDTISCLSEPAPCALFCTVGGYRVPVAWGHVYPKQFVLHSVEVDVDCAVVKVEKVGDYPDIALPHPPIDEITTLGQALLQRIQWCRRDIIVFPRQGSSQTVANNSTKTKSTSDAAKATRAPEEHAAPKSAPNIAATKSAADREQESNVAAKSGQEKKKMAAASKSTSAKSGQEKEKMAGATKTTAKEAGSEGSNKQQSIKSSNDAAGKKQSKKKRASSPWTQPNPHYKYGRPMMTTDEFNTAGPATIELHNYYLKACGEMQKDIVVEFKRAHFQRSSDKECFLVGFNDLYDLYNLDALDVSLIRCFTLSMILETKEKNVPVGFLDPQMLSMSTIISDRSYVVDYVAKAMQKFVKKKLIMFPHNIGGHWVLAVIIPKWKKVLYFDSLRNKPRNFTQLKDVLNEAFVSYCKLKKVAKETLEHVTKFPCHQQPPGNACGFYVVHHVMKAMELLSMDRDPEEFEVMTTPISLEALHFIREKVASFIMNQVISEKGEFHCSNPRHFS